MWSGSRSEATIGPFCPDPHQCNDMVAIGLFALQFMWIILEDICGYRLAQLLIKFSCSLPDQRSGRKAPALSASIRLLRADCQPSVRRSQTPSRSRASPESGAIRR